MPSLDAPAARRLPVPGGPGRPVVLVHGWAMSPRAFAPQVSALGGRFGVVAPALRGHGPSAPDGAASFTLDDFVGDLAALFARADLRGAVLAGWSWGAEIALAALPLVRDRVAALALIAATPRFTCAPDWPHGLPESRVRALRARMARAPEETRRGFAEAMFAEGELPATERERIVRELLEDRPDPAAAAGTLDALASADLRDGVRAAAGLPTLIVHGDRDAICLPAASAWLHDQLPGSRREVLAGAGHAPQLSRAGEVTSLLVELAGSAA